MGHLAWAAAAATVLSGFFALNGYALRGSSLRDLQTAFGRGGRARAESLRRHSTELQMVCALLRVLSNLALLVSMLHVFQAGPGQLLRLGAAVASAAGILSIFGVAIPHAWARHSGCRVLSATGGALLVLRLVLWPAVVVMNGFAAVVARLSGAASLPGQGDRPGRSSAPATVREEILQAATLAQAEGVVPSEEMQMIESVIRFGDRRVGEIMTPRTDIVALPLDASGEEIRRTVIAAGHTRLPVYDGGIDNIVGILHAKEVLAADDVRRLDLRKAMRKPFFVPQTKRLADLLREFRASKEHLAVILDEYGGTAGLVTIDDLLEEIVGEMADEYGQAPRPRIHRLDERSVEVDGRTRISELNDALGLHLPQTGQYDTVAGLLFTELGFVPPVGETLSAGGAKLTVLAADARTIRRVRVELPGGEQA